MIRFDEAHRAVYYPDDRRFRIWIRPSILIPLLFFALGPFVLAWIQNAIFGLPYIAPAIASHEGVTSGPHGFPFWSNIRGSISTITARRTRNGSASRPCECRRAASGRPRTMDVTSRRWS